MLYEDQRISKIPEFVQRTDQSLVVPRMQTDGWLVEHIKHSGQSAPKLTRQSNSLGLTARERCCGASKCEVIQTNIIQKLQASFDFSDQFTDDLPVARRQASNRKSFVAAALRAGEQADPS